MGSDNRWRLNSPAAADVRWYFRCAGAALGARASVCEVPAETIRKPRAYVCTCGADVLEGMMRCPKCKDRLRPLGTMRAKQSHSGGSEGLISEPQRDASRKWRRIHGEIGRAHV